MSAFFAALAKFAYERIWLSKKSTILGLLVFAAGELLNYFAALPTLPVSAHLILGLLVAPFLAWKEKEIQQGKIIELQPPRGFISLRTLLAIFTGSMLLAGMAHGQEAAPAPAPVADPAPSPSQFGGCIKSGKICFAPSIAIAVGAINLRTKTVEGAFSPGIGYGVTFNPGRWSSLGADAYFILSPSANQATFSILAKLLNGYARVGYSKGFIGDTAPRLLFATGVDIP